MNSCKFIKNLVNTKARKINYLLTWFNKNDNKYYIIQLGDGIFVNGLDSDYFYNIITEKESQFYAGVIFTKWNRDFLISSFENGIIDIWDLYDYFHFKEIIIKKNALPMHISLWNNKYIIASDYNNKSFRIIDL